MSDNTENLNLYLTDMETDGDDLFDFDRDLNQNWEKLDKRFGVANITLLATGWTGSAAPYTQTVNIEGITAAHNPHVALNPNSDYDTSQGELQEYAKLYDGVTSAGAITFYAKEQPGINLNLKVKIL